MFFPKFPLVYDTFGSLIIFPLILVNFIPHFGQFPRKTFGLSVGFQFIGIYREAIEAIDTPHDYPLVDIENLFAYPLKEKLRLLVFQVLDVEESIETVTQYPMLFNNLLSVASMLYFTDLNIEEKLDLLNNKFELDDLISLLQKYNYKWDFWNWKLANSYLDRNGFYELALTMHKILMKLYFNLVKEEEKYYLFESLATIYRNLKNYDKALEYYEEAYRWIDKASMR